MQFWPSSTAYFRPSLRNLVYHPQTHQARPVLQRPQFQSNDSDDDETQQYELSEIEPGRNAHEVDRDAFDPDANADLGLVAVSTLCLSTDKIPCRRTGSLKGVKLWVADIMAWARRFHKKRDEFQLRSNDSTKSMD